VSRETEKATGSISYCSEEKEARETFSRSVRGGRENGKCFSGAREKLSVLPSRSEETKRRRGIMGGLKNKKQCRLDY